MKTSPQATVVRLSDRLFGSFSLLCAAALFGGPGAGPLSGQDAASSGNPGGPGKDETIVLSPFTVTGNEVGRYQPTDAASGGRIAISLMDAPQSISVVTREQIEDVGGWRLQDALQYSTGVTEGTIPNGQDRLTIRGFQIDGQTVDNFKSYSQAVVDPVFVERIEVVKGPNEVLAPAGVPGGTVNIVSRKPQFTGNFGSVTLEDGAFAAERAELDVNEVWGQAKDVAFRMVGTAEETKGRSGDPRKVYAFMPMVAFRSKTGAQLVLQFSYTESHVQNYLGIPIDPSSGSTNDGTLLSGVSRYFNFYDTDYRHEHRPEYRALLTVPLFDNIAMRLAARYTDFQYEGLQNLVSTTAANYGGATNPLTGYYTPGFVYGPGPTYTPTPAPAFPATLTRGGTLESDNWCYANVQNDYVYTFKSNVISLTSLVGAAFNLTRDNSLIINTTKPSVNLYSYVPASGAYTLGAVSSIQHTTNYDEQLYANQMVGFFQNRLQFNGGYSVDTYDLTTNDIRLNQRYEVNLHAQLRSGGVVIDPLPGTALYYSYTESATPTGWPDSINTAYAILASGSQPLQTGAQNEYGVREDILDKRLFATLAYFDIVQNNYGVQNPGNLVTPAPVPPLPQLFSDRRSKGWEFELHATISQQLSIAGNCTSFTNRDPHDVPFRGTAEKSGAVMANYQFKKISALAGLSVMVGVDYLAKRPGDAASGVTAASTATDIIPNQPTFWLPARTLVNAGGGYKITRDWKVRLDVTNLFDTSYLLSSLSRFSVLPGEPTNVRCRVTYSF